MSLAILDFWLDSVTQTLSVVPTDRERSSYCIAFASLAILIDLSFIVVFESLPLLFAIAFGLSQNFDTLVTAGLISFSRLIDFSKSSSFFVG
jgi:hypothetical protein